MRARVRLKRPTKAKAAPVDRDPLGVVLPAIDLPPARIMLPTPPVKVVEPGRPRKERSPLGVAPAPREGLGPEGEGDWLLHTLVVTAIWIALEVHRWW